MIQGCNACKRFWRRVCTNPESAVIDVDWETGEERSVHVSINEARSIGKCGATAELFEPA